ncbi:MAG: hypothetical protein R3E66_09045 [bacterium]
MVCAAANEAWETWDLLFEDATSFETLAPEFGHALMLCLAAAMAQAADQDERAEHLRARVETVLPAEMVSQVVELLTRVDVVAHVPEALEALAEESEPDIFEAQREVVNIEDALAAIQDSSGQFEPYHDDYYDDSEISEGSDAEEVPESEDPSNVDPMDDLDEHDELSEIQDELDELAQLEVPSSTRNKPILATPVPPEDSESE